MQEVFLRIASVSFCNVVRATAELSRLCIVVPIDFITCTVLLLTRGTHGARGKTPRIRGNGIISIHGGDGKRWDLLKTGDPADIIIGQ